MKNTKLLGIFICAFCVVVMLIEIVSFDSVKLGYLKIMNSLPTHMTREKTWFEQIEALFTEKTELARSEILLDDNYTIPYNPKDVTIYVRPDSDSYFGRCHSLNVTSLILTDNGVQRDLFSNGLLLPMAVQT